MGIPKIKLFNCPMKSKSDLKQKCWEQVWLVLFSLKLYFSIKGCQLAKMHIVQRTCIDLGLSSEYLPLLICCLNNIRAAQIFLSSLEINKIAISTVCNISI